MSAGIYINENEQLIPAKNHCVIDVTVEHEKAVGGLIIPGKNTGTGLLMRGKIHAMPKENDFTSEFNVGDTVFFYERAGQNFDVGGSRRFALIRLMDLVCRVVNTEKKECPPTNA